MQILIEPLLGTVLFSCCIIPLPVQGSSSRAPAVKEPGASTQQHRALQHTASIHFSPSSTPQSSCRWTKYPLLEMHTFVGLPSGSDLITLSPIDNSGSESVA